MLIDLPLNPNSLSNTLTALEHALEHNRAIRRKYGDNPAYYQRVANARLRMQCLRILVRGLTSAEHIRIGRVVIVPTDIELLTRWQADCLIADPHHAFTSSTALYKSWFAWARLNAAQPYSVKWLTRRLYLDFNQRRARGNTGHHGFFGLRIREHAPSALQSPTGPQNEPPRSIADLL